MQQSATNMQKLSENMLQTTRRNVVLAWRGSSSTNIWRKNILEKCKQKALLGFFAVHMNVFKLVELEKRYKMEIDFSSNNNDIKKNIYWFWHTSNYSLNVFTSL